MKDIYYYVKKSMVVITVLALVVAAGLQGVAVKAEEVLKIGILQYVEHDSLNATYLGVIEGLEELGYVEGENLEIEYLNAAADNTNLQSMSEKLVKGNDYLVAIATPAAQALANITQDKPIYFSAVSDPVGSGLVKSLEKPGTNVTGATDAAPLEQQATLVAQVAPDAKKVALLYNAGESNSVPQAKEAKSYLEALGYEVEEATVTSTNDISQVMGALVGKVDALFTVTDNTVASAMTLVGDLAIEAQLPLIGGSEDMVLQNGLVTYGMSYYDLGKQTAEMLVRQIKTNEPIEEMAVEKANTFKLVVNEEVAKKLGINPEEISILEE